MNAIDYTSTVIKTESFLANSAVNSVASEIASTKKRKRLIRKVKNGTYRNIENNTQASAQIVDLIVYREQKNSTIVEAEVFGERPYTEGIRRDLRSQLAKLRATKDNWDGLGAKAPDQGVLQTSSYLIDKWNIPLSIIAEICPLSDGAVCFEFYDDADNLIGAIDLLTDGFATYAFTNGNTITDAGEIDVNDDNQLLATFELLKRAKAARE